MSIDSDLCGIAPPKGLAAVRWWESSSRLTLLLGVHTLYSFAEAPLWFVVVNHQVCASLTRARISWMGEKRCDPVPSSSSSHIYYFTSPCAEISIQNPNSHFIKRPFFFTISRSVFIILPHRDSNYFISWRAMEQCGRVRVDVQCRLWF